MASDSPGGVALCKAYPDAGSTNGKPLDFNLVELITRMTSLFFQPPETLTAKDPDKRLRYPFPPSPFFVPSALRTVHDRSRSQFYCK